MLLLLLGRSSFGEGDEDLIQETVDLTNYKRKRITGKYGLHYLRELVRTFQGVSLLFTFRNILNSIRILSMCTKNVRYQEQCLLHTQLHCTAS